MSTLHPTHRALLAGAALAFGLAGPALAQSAAAPAGEAPRALAEPAGQPPCTVAALRGSCAFSVRGFTDAASGLPPAPKQSGPQIVTAPGEMPMLSGPSFSVRNSLGLGPSPTKPT